MLTDLWAKMHFIGLVIKIIKSNSSLNISEKEINNIATEINKIPVQNVDNFIKATELSIKNNAISDTSMAEQISLWKSVIVMKTSGEKITTNWIFGDRKFRWEEEEYYIR